LWISLEIGSLQKKIVQRNLVVVRYTYQERKKFSFKQKRNDRKRNETMTKEICETSGCTKTVEVNYLGSPLCSKCKNEVQDHRYEGGRFTMAVAGFKSKYPRAYETGRIQNDH